MKQIFILGSSTVYGVGAQTAGWADLVKQHYHQLMYAPGGVGEQYEVFNFGKSGAEIAFVRETFPVQLEHYGRGGELLFLLAVGGNNAKAVGEPNNFVSTPEEYAQAMGDLLRTLQEHGRVVVVGGGVVDETKTNPRRGPMGGVSYFTNARRQQFNALTQQLCDELGIPVVAPKVTPEEWLAKYIYDDGLHANQAGYELVFNELKPYLHEGKTA